MGRIWPGLKEKSWEEAFTFCLVPCIHDESGKSARMSHPYCGEQAYSIHHAPFASARHGVDERIEVAGTDEISARAVHGNASCSER